MPDAVGALVFIVGGAVAWVRRPENFTGPVLVLSGALWVVGSNEGAPNGAIAAISYAFGGYYDLTLAYLALAFPTGRVDDAPGRAVLGLLAATLVTRSLARLLVNEPSVYYSDLCPDCPPNPFRIALNQTLYEAVEWWGTALLALLTLVVLALLIRRWGRATSPARRVIAPVIVAGGLAMALAAYAHTARVAGLAFGLSLLPASEALRRVVVWGLFAGRALVPIGFLIGVLRLRPGRAVVADLVLGLTDEPPRERLRASLAHALADPTLTLAYWSPERGRYVDAQGRAMAAPEDGEDRAVTFL
ncbi:MAG TPA: hypothetical protein VJ868_08965, partial [Actinomycetota bacterium]|nr:hypothetical protein [Actinomycetota bacterium]